MADIFTVEKRSEVMAAIRSSHTKPEERLASMAEAVLGDRYPFERHVCDLPGRPDILIPGLALALFADGCFFHVCPQHGRIPTSNVEYWGPKLERNRLRDGRNRRKLRRMGYGVWRFWEHDLRGRRAERTAAVLERRLARRMSQSPPAAK
ncbi:MAG: mismatch endonuclease, patch repair protein [Thermoleophilaceae bacterium]|nr:mismatch endonuclease, patch repair protein [Thermoleophilaceae bacterium]